jgi:hypothetical protein
MRGSIRKRGSTYTYWLDIGPDPATGKRRQRTKGGFRTKRECQAALNEAIAGVQDGTFVEPSRRTVRSFVVEEWLPAVQVANLRPGTWGRITAFTSRHTSSLPAGRSSCSASPLPSSTPSTAIC